MVRVLLYLALVAVFASGAVWIVNRPGDIVVNWQGYRIETSVAVLAVAVALLAALTVVLWNLMRWILAGPEAFALFRRNRRRARGYDAIARGVVAVGTGDARRAGKEASEARKLLGKEPLTLVLAAQAAQLAGDRAGAEAAFRAMAERPETRSLGLRGLFIEAERRGDRAAAKALAAEAARQSPESPWAGQALFEYQSAEHDWAGALATLERLGANRLVDKAEARRKRAVLLTAQAMDGASSDTTLAVKRAREAHSLAPDFVPAAALAARLLAEQGDARKATKIVDATWGRSPHPDLAEVYVHVRPGDAARDKLKRARVLADRAPTEPEGMAAVARAAMAARELDVARMAIDRLLAARPTARACMLMAELEEIQHGETGRSREWLGRAIRAPRDAAWVADGVASEIWAPVSPATGRLDAFVWKTPVEESRPRLAAEAWLDQGPVEPLRPIEPVAALPAAVEPPAPPAAPPPPAKEKPAAEKPAAKPAEKAIAAPVEAPAEPLPREMPTLLDGAEAEKPALTVVEGSAPVREKAAKPKQAAPRAAEPPRPTAAVFPLSRAPDDPGTHGVETPDTIAGADNFPASRPNY